MKNFSLNQTQWLVSLLSACRVSVVSRLWKLAAVLLRRGRGVREGGGVPKSSVPASLHCPGAQHQPLDQQTSETFLPPKRPNNACKHASREWALFTGPQRHSFKEKFYQLIYFSSGRKSSVFVALACVMDWSSESSKECQMHCTDKAGGRRGGSEVVGTLKLISWLGDEGCFWAL